VKQWLLLNAKWTILQLVHWNNSLCVNCRNVALVVFFVRSMVTNKKNHQKSLQLSTGRYTQIHFQDSKATSLYSCSLILISRDTANTNILVFGLIQPGQEPMIYRSTALEMSLSLIIHYAIMTPLYIQTLNLISNIIDYLTHS